LFCSQVGLYRSYNSLCRCWNLPFKIGRSNGKWEKEFAMLTRGVKSHDNLHVLCHSTRVFIGTRGVACPCQRHLDPRLPGLSLECSHEGRLQPVIMVYFITDMAQPTHAHARPNFVGRIVHGPLPALRKWEVMWSSTGPLSCLAGAKGAEQASVWLAPLVCPTGPADAVFIRAA
jgi:hypothetical protein